MVISAIGILATLITIGSFLFKDVKSIRMVNFIGCLIWLLYGYLKIDFPVITVNAAIALIHLHSFIKAEQDHDNSNTR
jgi:hypothetical protein